MVEPTPLQFDRSNPEHVRALQKPDSSVTIYPGGKFSVSPKKSSDAGVGQKKTESSPAAKAVAAKPMRTPKTTKQAPKRPTTTSTSKVESHVQKARNLENLARKNKSI